MSIVPENPTGSARERVGARLAAKGPRTNPFLEDVRELLADFDRLADAGAERCTDHSGPWALTDAEPEQCALPADHGGWHASAPRLDAAGFTVAGATWSRGETSEAGQ